jgi:hypothetical protein
VVGVAGTAAVRLDPRFRINEMNQVSERRVYFFIFYIVGLEKNPAIVWRLHSRHLTSAIRNPKSEIRDLTSPNPFHTYQMTTILRLKGNVIICPAG